MLLDMCKSKIHKARLTECVLEYEGSLGIDLDLLDASGILPYEKILVVNANNGERLETYAIPLERGSRSFTLNGPAAHKGSPGDTITVMAFGRMDEAEAKGFKPKIIVLDAANAITARKGSLA